ncbi:MAG TPA: histidinol-phosphate transaminase [Lachnospiraceae bacterium]
MLKHKDHFHGSDLEKIEQIYGIKKESIISFSSNVNPLGISDYLKQTLGKELDKITSYPDRKYTALRESIGRYVCAPPEHIIVGNGSTELISLFIQEHNVKKALILGPTYSEYEREVGLDGGISLYYPLKEEDNFTINMQDFISHLDSSIDLLILCNPNNPTSGAINKKDMRKILSLCMETNTFVLVDETYVEFSPNPKDISAISLTNSYSNLAVLRGTSKFFAAPGLRLGYAVTGNEELKRRILTKQNPWAINTLAEIAGRIMFEDKDYQQKTYEFISHEKERLAKKLADIPHLKVYPSAANFFLCRIKKPSLSASDIFDACIREGLMIRNCASFPFLDESYFRFCIMKKDDNDHLLSILKNLLS